MGFSLQGLIIIHFKKFFHHHLLPGPMSTSLKRLISTVVLARLNLKCCSRNPADSDSKWTWVRSLIFGETNLRCSTDSTSTGLNTISATSICPLVAEASKKRKLVHLSFFFTVCFFSQGSCQPMHPLSSNNAILRQM